MGCEALAEEQLVVGSYHTRARLYGAGSKKMPQPLHRTVPLIYSICPKDKCNFVIAWKTPERSTVPSNTSALQAQRVQISPRTIKGKHTNTFATLQSCRWNSDFNEPEGWKGGNTRCINAPVSQDQTSENLWRSQWEKKKNKDEKTRPSAKQG